MQRIFDDGSAGSLKIPARPLRRTSLPMPHHIINLKDEPTPSEEAKPPTASVAESTEDIPEHLRETITIFSWDAPEFVERKKDESRWIRRVIIAATPLVLLFLLMRNILGAILVIIGGFTFLLEAFRKPRTVHFAITNKGIEIDGHSYPYRDLKSFWIFNDSPQERSISITTKRVLNQKLVLPLGNLDPIEMRKILLPFLPEVRELPSALEMWLRRIGY
jgi:hypothetical protein